MDVSILIISFNTRQLTLACLRSIYARTHGVSFEVIVVDNASTDGSAQAIAEQFPLVRLLCRKENLGFARGNNLAAQEARGRFLLLLNPDTAVLDNAVATLHRFALSHDGRGIFGGRTLFPDGTLNPTSCWRRPTLWSVFCVSSGLSSLFRRSRVFDPESYGPWPRDSVRQVDIVTGCFLMIEQSLWERLGGFDPSFFMYGEEADLCLRAARAGYRCWICPDAQIIHYGGASETVRADTMVRLFCAKKRLFLKHWGASRRRLGTVALSVWAFSRMLAFTFLKRLKPRWAEAHRTWLAIWRRRAEWQVNSSIPTD